MTLLSAFSESDPESAMRRAALISKLKDLGWRQGGNLEITLKYAGGDENRLANYVSECVATRPNVILAETTSAAVALYGATKDIPIIFTAVSDPIGVGLAKSLAHPGTNVTGFANFEPTQGQKLLEVLKEIAPNITRAVVIFDPVAGPHNESFIPSVLTAAVSLGVELTFARVHSDAEIVRAVEGIEVKRNTGLVVFPDATTALRRDTIIAQAAEYRLPAAYPVPLFARSGGLVAYGFDTIDVIGSVATYIDRILTGTKPEDLPVQMPVIYHLIINIRTARALGLNIPPTLLARADEVIE